MPASKDLQRGQQMGSPIVTAIIIAFIWSAYHSGKRIGSRKGFHVGR
jgi:hypothetical protein